MQPFIVNDFSGGITDQSLTAGPKYATQLHNFLISEDGKPYVRPGFELFDRMPVSLAQTRCSGIYIGSEPFGRPVFIRTNKAYNLNESDGFTEILGPTLNPAIPNKTNTSQEAAVQWRRQLIVAGGYSTVLPSRLYCSVLSPTTFVSLTLGLPALAAAPTITSSGGTGSNYVYALHYYYEFTDYSGVTFVEQGPVTEVSVTNVGAPNSNSITVGSGATISTLANTASTNYQTSTALKIKLFRTINNGTTLFLLTTLSNGTTSYVDSTSDTTLQTAETIYTAGDVLEWTKPPVGALYVTEANDYFWYATERSVFQSIQGAPGACPEEYETAPGQRIRGLGSIISYPILFCDQSVYRIEGVFDEFGDGGFEFKEISKVAGCISNRSIVAVPGGLVWAGNGGFWFTNGNECKKISKHLNQRYETWRSPTTVGAYDPLKDMVYWTISSPTNSSLTPTDQIAVLHLQFGLTEESVFTTVGSVNNIFPTALAFTSSTDTEEEFRYCLLMADAYGFFMSAKDTTYTDPDLNLVSGKTPAELDTKAIIYRYESTGHDLGGEVARAYSSFLTYELSNETDIAVTFITRRDETGTWGNFAETRSDGAIIWGDSEFGWDDPNDSILHGWNDLKLVEGKRHFPATQLRSTRRQIGMTNALAWIAKSDDANKGLATSVASTKVITLNTLTSFWPEECEGYEISFASSSYATFYKIKERNSDTSITVYDPYATLTSAAGVKWQIRGYRKFERPYLLSYTINFTTDGMTQAPPVTQTSYQNV